MARNDIVGVQHTAIYPLTGLPLAHIHTHAKPRSE
jgi:hypothetical protein